MKFLEATLNFLGYILGRYYLLLLFGLTLLWTFDFSDKRTGGLIWSDAEGYYMYLPAVFIYDGFVDIPVRTTDQFKHFPGTDKYFTKYTYGVALMQLPFFYAFHTAAKIMEQPLTGYSDYYIYSIYFAAAFYAFIALLFLRKILERNFSGWVTLLIILSLYFGTNMYYYTTVEAGMSHIYSLCLFTLFIYYTPQFYKRAKFKTYVIFGLLAGLIVLIRPTNALLLLYLIFYNIHSWKDMMARFRFFLRNLWNLPIIPFFSFLVFLPQFFYWHYISGDYIFYSYGEEGFNWDKAQIGNVLFNIKNGWLLFNPIAVIPLIGAFIGARRNKYNIALILAITVLAIYIFASWYCWWFGGAYGYRSMVEFYALLAIPFAYISHLVFRQKQWGLKVFYMLLLVVLIYYNLGLIDHYVGPHYDWRTWKIAMGKLFW